MALRANVNSSNYKTFRCGDGPVALADLKITHHESLLGHQSQSGAEPLSIAGVNAPQGREGTNDEKMFWVGL